MRSFPRYLASFWTVLQLVAHASAFVPKQQLPFVRFPLHACASLATPAVELPETSPLPPHTFAGMIERGIKERFGSDADRVVESLRLRERDYEHNVYVGPPGQEGTSSCIQVSNSYVPGLAIREFWDTEGIQWVKKLKSKYKIILEEFQQVTADLKSLQKQGNNIWAGALTQDAASYGEGWKTLVLKDRSYWDETNAQLFPKTSKAVHDSGAPAVEVFFASMQPETSIKPHSDFANFVLTSHLALDIPYSGENKCRLTIGDETRQWINGDITLFDTSLIHDAANDSDRMRYILMMRIWHPDLTEKERDALQFIYDCLTAPELVTGGPAERSKAEKQLERLKAFPNISVKTGFGVGAKNTGKKKSKSKKQ